MRIRLAVLAAVLVLLLLFFAWHFRSTKHAAEPLPSNSATPSSAILLGAQAPANSPETAPTNVYAHNLMLRKGPDFRIYVRWLRGQMIRTSRDVNPSFDDPESFSLDVKTGVIRANMGDINNFLNANAIADSPLKNISLSGDGDQVKLHGDVHKVISLPIELTGTINAVPENRIQLHVTKLSVLKLPLKGFLQREMCEIRFIGRQLQQQVWDAWELWMQLDSCKKRE